MVSSHNCFFEKISSKKKVFLLLSSQERKLIGKVGSKSSFAWKVKRV